MLNTEIGENDIKFVSKTFLIHKKSLANFIRSRAESIPNLFQKYSIVDGTSMQPDLFDDFNNKN